MQVKSAPSALFYGMMIRTGEIYQYANVVYLVALKTLECKVLGLLGCDGVTWVHAVHLFEGTYCLHLEM